MIKTNVRNIQIKGPPAFHMSVMKGVMKPQLTHHILKVGLFRNTMRLANSVFRNIFANMRKTQVKTLIIESPANKFGLNFNLGLVSPRCWLTKPKLRFNGQTCLADVLIHDKNDYPAAPT